MKHIGNISYAEGAVKKRKRVGRGAGSGHGGTSTRGHKGNQSRSGYKTKRGFEGGQMPLSRRLPKYGFTNIFKKEYQTINVSRLQELYDAGKLNVAEVDTSYLFEIGAVAKRSVPVKILGNGEITAKVHLVVDKISEAAKEKIEKAGGSVKING